MLGRRKEREGTWSLTVPCLEPKNLRKARISMKKTFPYGIFSMKKSLKCFQMKDSGQLSKFLGTPHTESALGAWDRPETPTEMWPAWCTLSTPGYLLQIEPQVSKGIHTPWLGHWKPQL